MKNSFFFFVLIVFIYSCARVGSPNGGAKDITPPIFLKANIDTTRVNVSTKLRELRLDFDEYITLKDISKNLIISPPIKRIKKILPSNLANKYILIQWEEDLLDNTTYNFNFGNSIVDNNEGNVLPYFNFAFSTGQEIDNLYISGTVTDALLPPKISKKKNILVGLYPNDDFKQKPYYITSADEDGYFELNYLSQGQYTLIAFEDENQNSIYDAGKEKVGFLNEKINLTENISGLNISLYPSKKTVKYLNNQKIIGGLLLNFEGNPEKVDIQSISEELSHYKISHQAKSDSVKVWIDKDNNQFKKESATQIKFGYHTPEKQDTISLYFKPNEKDEFILENSKGNLLPPSKDFIISSNMELNQINSQNWELKSDSINVEFTAKISEHKPNEIHISADFKPEKKYSLKVPKESVSSYYYENSNAYLFNFEVDKSENYGNLVLKLQNIPQSYFWVQLINREGKIVYNQYTNQSEIRFTELTPATYYARILVDKNNNKYWEEADFFNNIPAEKAFLFPKEITIRKLWEIIEDWNLE